MESLGYLLMYFNLGTLPWQGLNAGTKRQKYEKITEKKMSTNVDVLCRSYPSEFATYLNYCRALQFDDKPDYSFLRQMFRSLFHRQGFIYDYIFDWNHARAGGSRAGEESSRRREVATEPPDVGVGPQSFQFRSASKLDRGFSAKNDGWDFPNQEERRSMKHNMESLCESSAEGGVRRPSQARGGAGGKNSGTREVTVLPPQ